MYGPLAILLPCTIYNKKYGFLFEIFAGANIWPNNLLGEKVWYRVKRIKYARYCQVWSRFFHFGKNISRQGGAGGKNMHLINNPGRLRISHCLYRVYRFKYLGRWRVQMVQTPVCIKPDFSSIKWIMFFTWFKYKTLYIQNSIFTSSIVLLLGEQTILKK